MAAGHRHQWFWGTITTSLHSEPSIKMIYKFWTNMRKVLGLQAHSMADRMLAPGSSFKHSFPSIAQFHQLTNLVPPFDPALLGNPSIFSPRY